MKIALVGVSSDKNKFGYKIFEDLLANGFKVKGINPRNGEILNQRIYRNLAELEEIPDVVLTVVKPEVTEKVVEEAHHLGIKRIWMQPGSQSELAIEKAQKYGIEVTYGKCFMRENGIW